MLEGSLHSIWASMNSWFTPTVLFLLLNIMIGTIAVASSFGTKKHQEQQNQNQEHPQPQLVRAPSILQRLKSINFYHYRPEEENPVHTITTTLQEPETDTIQTLEQNPNKVSDHHVSRTKSETKRASGEVPVKLPEKMKKSATVKSAFGHFEEREIVNRGRPLFGDDDEVDVKADNFINKFKQQLKLQRLDSILRYKEMLNRGASSAK